MHQPIHFSKCWMILSTLIAMSFVGFSQAGQSKLDSTIQRIDAMPNDSSKAAQMVLLGHSLLYNQPVEARKYGIRAFRLADSLGVYNESIRATQLVGYYYRNRGSLDSAQYFFEQALITAEQAIDSIGIAASLASIGNLHNQRAHYEEARDFYVRSIDISEALGDSIEVAKISANMATTYIHQGDFPQAKRMFLASLDYFMHLGHSNFAASIYNNLTPIYLNEGKADTALQLVRNTIPVFIQQNDFKGVSSSHISLANIFQQISMVDSSVYHLQQALDYSEQLSDTLKMALIFSKLGALYDQQGLYGQALTEYIKYLEISDSKRDEQGMAIANKQIGLSYRNQGLINEAMEYFKKGLVIAEKIGLSREVGDVCTKIGETMMSQGQLDSAQVYLNRAEEVLIAANFRPGLANTLQKQGILSKKQGRSARAERQLQESLDLWELLENKRGQASTLLELGRLQLQNNNTQRALSELSTAEDLAESIGDLGIQEGIYESLAEAYKQLSRYDLAYDYFTKYTTVHDSLSEESRLKELAQIRTAFETEKRDAQIQQLRAEQELRTAKSRQQLTLVIVSAGILILLIVGVFLWIRYRQQQELNKKQLALEKERASKEKERSEQLEKIDHLKDQFLANTSHELRTPLQGIIGLTESLIEDQRLSGRKEDLEMIISSGKRLNNLVNDLLDFSKLKNDELSLSRMPVDMRAAVNVVMVLSQPLLHGKDVQIINSVSNDVPLVDADENRVQQVLHNLIGNAIKFTDHVKIEISSETIEDLLKVKVMDTGIGIPEDQHESIFQSFEQVESSNIREFGGTGLGLTISKQLVELHGGSISVDSKVGEGSTFIFTLPLSKVSRKEFKAAGMTNYGDMVTKVQEDISITEGVRQQPSSSAASDKVRILVVDDEPVNRRVLQNHLSQAGYEVTQAIDGLDALSILEQNKDYDLIILDIMMPHMSGYEVCNKLRDFYLPSELPVVMLTAKNRVSDLMEGFEAGANDYLTKPFSKDELLSRIKTHLNLHRIHKATGKFVPFEFLRAVGRETITDVQLGDHSLQDVSVLFTDIRDYTTFAEKLSPEDNFNFINAYVGRMGPIIRRNRGFVNQYYGDGIMALFPTSADHCLDACIEMQREITAYNVNREDKNKLPLSVGMGMHFGPLVMGIIGDNERNEPSTIADTVNVASRMEGLTKHYGANIILSEQCIDSLSEKERFHFRNLGRMQVKGKMEVLNVYECIDGDEENLKKGKLESMDLYSIGLDLYHRKEFGEATALFSRILKEHPNDKVVDFFKNRSARYTHEGVPPDWTGVERLLLK